MMIFFGFNSLSTYLKPTVLYLKLLKTLMKLFGAVNLSMIICNLQFTISSILQGSYLVHFLSPSTEKNLTQKKFPIFLGIERFCILLFFSGIVSLFLIIYSVKFSLFYLSNQYSFYQIALYLTFINIFQYIFVYKYERPFFEDHVSR